MIRKQGEPLRRHGFKQFVRDDLFDPFHDRLGHLEVREQFGQLVLVRHLCGMLGQARSDPVHPSVGEPVMKHVPIGVSSNEQRRNELRIAPRRGHGRRRNHEKENAGQNGDVTQHRCEDPLPKPR